MSLGGENGAAASAVIAALRVPVLLSHPPPGVSVDQFTSVKVRNPNGSFGQLPGGGGVVTDTFAVPLCPSEVAVMPALPAATAVTRPVAETVATAVFVLAQLIVRPVSTLPLASLSTAVACVVWPTMRLLVPNDTVTEATGTAITTTCTEPLTPPLVAVMVVVPAASAVMSPVALMLAATRLELDHVTVRPVSTLPLASLSIADA